MPGLDGTGWLFRWFTEKMPFEQEWLAVAYAASDAADLDALADLALKFLPNHRPVILVAESFSCPIALRLLSRRPAMIRGAVFVAGFARRPIWMLRLLDAVPPRFIAALATRKALLRWFCVDAETPRGVVDTILSAIQQLPLRTLRGRLKLLNRINETPSLLTLDIPYLHLHAEYDRLVEARRTADFGLNSRYGTMQSIKGPHFLLQTRPSECWHAISNWLAKSIPAE